MAGTADPLELEHVIGYTGRHRSALTLHREHETGFVYGLGANVTLADVADPHEQIFLRGHTGDISALDLSNNGKLVASGQVRAASSASGDAPVYVWEAMARKRLHAFAGITQAVSVVRFSPDDIFLAAAGADLTLCIWDLTTGELLFTKRMGVPSADLPGVSVMQWTAVDRTQRRPKYNLVFNVIDRMHLATLEYDYKVMKYTVSVHQAAIPSTGFSRVYTCGAYEPQTNSLLCGTTAGELVCFGLNPLPVFKGAVQASAHGVHALVCPKLRPGADAAVVFVGGGDGSVRCFAGREISWAPLSDVQTIGRVVTLSVAASNSWLLVGTDMGQIYRVSWSCDLADLRRGSKGSATMIEASHTSSVNASAFVSTKADAVVTVGSDTSVRLWALDNYDLKWVNYSGGPSPTCVWVDNPIAGTKPATKLGVEALPPAGRPTGLPPVAGLRDGMPVVAHETSGDLTPVQAYCGYSDGSVRGFDVFHSSRPDGHGTVEAFKQMAHKGGVTCISGNKAIIVTGGVDGRVCIWSRKGHDLLYSFCEHSKPVVGVLADVANIELIYSLGSDRLLNTYNLRVEKRVKVHAFPRTDTSAASFTSLSQNPMDGTERELFTGTNDGRIYCWDVDIPDVPVGLVDLVKLLPPEVVPKVGAATSAPTMSHSVATTRALAAASGMSTAYTTGTGMAPPRPDLRINALACSPSGRFLAVATHSALVVVLAVGKSGTAIVPPGGLQAPGMKALPKLSDIDNMKLASVFQGLSAYLDIKWSPDERQLVATAADGCTSVFNWFG